MPLLCTRLFQTHLDLSILTPIKNKPGIHFFKDNVEGYLQAEKKGASDLLPKMVLTTWGGTTRYRLPSLYLIGHAAGFYCKFRYFTRRISYLNSDLNVPGIDA